MDRGNPLDGSGTGDTRTAGRIERRGMHMLLSLLAFEVRVITRYQQNPFDLRPPKAMRMRRKSGEVDHMLLLDL